MVRAVGKGRMLPSTPENSNYTAARLEVNARARGANLGAAESPGLSSRPNPVPLSRRRLFIIVK
jgi:hypothetical protein